MASLSFHQVVGILNDPLAGLVIVIPLFRLGHREPSHSLLNGTLRADRLWRAHVAGRADLRTPTTVPPNGFEDPTTSPFHPTSLSHLRTFHRKCCGPGWTNPRLCPLNQSPWIPRLHTRCFQRGIQRRSLRSPSMDAQASRTPNPHSLATSSSVASAVASGNGSPSPR